MITAKAARVNMGRSKSYQHGSCPRFRKRPRSPWALFPQSVPQLFLGRLHLAVGLVAKQNRAQFVALIIMGDKLAFRVGPAQVYSGWLHAEITDEMQAKVERFGPEIRHLLITNPFLASHVCAGDQTLRARVFPVRLPPHPAHDSIRVKRQV